jgi:hypothetical protein
MRSGAVVVEPEDEGPVHACRARHSPPNPSALSPSSPNGGGGIAAAGAADRLSAIRRRKGHLARDGESLLRLGIGSPARPSEYAPSTLRVRSEYAPSTLRVHWCEDSICGGVSGKDTRIYLIELAANAAQPASKATRLNCIGSADMGTFCTLDRVRRVVVRLDQRWDLHRSFFCLRRSFGRHCLQCIPLDQ